MVYIECWIELVEFLIKKRNIGIKPVWWCFWNEREKLFASGWADFKWRAFNSIVWMLFAHIVCAWLPCFDESKDWSFTKKIDNMKYCYWHSLTTLACQRWKKSLFGILAGRLWTKCKSMAKLVKGVNASVYNIHFWILNIK